MNYEEALDKAIKCLKLSKSSNQHEAALAAARAQEIIDKYNLSVDDISEGGEPKANKESIVDFGWTDPLHEVCQVDTQWTIRLADIIAKQNACRCFWHTKPTSSSCIKIVGRPSDVQAVRYLFEWLNREVRRLRRIECKGRSRKYQIDFSLGVVDTIYRKMHQQRKETIETVKKEAANPFALVRVEQSIAKMEAKSHEVAAWVEQNVNINKDWKGFRKQADLSARTHGQQAGEQIKFTKAKADIE